jgi:hypothetical protein
MLRRAKRTFVRKEAKRFTDLGVSVVDIEDLITKTYALMRKHESALTNSAKLFINQSQYKQ